MEGAGVAAVVALLALIASSAPALASATPSPTRATTAGTIALPPFSNVTYHSTVDRFPLSYAEWLPAKYNGSKPAPLVVYLHGLEGGHGNAVKGGVKSDLFNFLSQNSVEGVAARALLANASASGYILLALNTRTAGGYYVNSPCGGPQEHDVLDAIAHERTRHPIGNVYLLGFSMGAIGALSIAAHHPSQIEGIAVVGAATDAFEEQAWTQAKAAVGASWAVGAVKSWNLITCNNTTTSDALLRYLSAVRFDPGNLSDVSVWVAAGGGDLLTPDNASLWPYMEVNNSFVNSTCIVTTGEPANCTTTFRMLHHLNATNYDFRMVYEADAPHNIAQFAGGDVFSYWTGKLFGGYFQADYPPGPVTAAPNPP